MIHTVSVFVSFIAVFLKGFQHKNVNKNKYAAIFFTSYAMAAFDFVAISIVVKGDWMIMITSGAGASIGMLAAVYFHDRLFKPKEVAA